MPARLLLSALFLLLAACSGEPRPVAPPGKFGGHGEIPVLVINHGWHTGLLLDAQPAQARLPQLAERFGSVAYLEFGWGERDFYEATDAGVWLALQALLPGETVMHVVGINNSDELNRYLADAGVARLCLNEDELTALLEFLAASFQLTPEGQLMARGRSHAMGQFYNGAGYYHLANTCNVWTARALQSVGMALSSGTKLTSGSVMDYLERHPDVEVLSLVDNPRQLSGSQLSCP